MFSRHLVVQRFLDLFSDPAYLEIGVSQGATFLNIQANTKIGVDPKFMFDFKKYQMDDSSIEFFEVTSDEFFGRIKAPTQIFDVIFLDGLHTFEQTLRDLLNAVFCLRQNGVIIVDDIMPNSYHASLPDHQEAVLIRQFVGRHIESLLADASWMGDVFKLSFFIETFLQSFDYGCIVENHGQMVLWKAMRPRGDIIKRTMKEIVDLGFKDTITQRDCFRFMPLERILAAIKLSRE